MSEGSSVLRRVSLISTLVFSVALTATWAMLLGYKMGRALFVANVTKDDELDNAFAFVAVKKADGLVISPDALFTSTRNRLVALAAQHSVPTIYHLSEAVAAGGLMSYGTSFKSAHHLAGVYAGRILKGEKSDELPVQQSTKFEFAIDVAVNQKHLGSLCTQVCSPSPTR